jgi:hypothetical protein
MRLAKRDRKEALQKENEAQNEIQETRRKKEKKIDLREVG